MGFQKVCLAQVQAHRPVSGAPSMVVDLAEVLLEVVVGGGDCDLDHRLVCAPRFPVREHLAVPVPSCAFPEEEQPAVQVLVLPESHNQLLQTPLLIRTSLTGRHNRTVVRTHRRTHRNF